MKNSAILLIGCPDAKGEVATIADFVYRHNGNILHADENRILLYGNKTVVF
jgi:formyltetrahydrofolate deformylase